MGDIVFLKSKISQPVCDWQIGGQDVEDIVFLKYISLFVIGRLEGRDVGDIAFLKTAACLWLAD